MIGREGQFEAIGRAFGGRGSLAADGAAALLAGWGAL